MIVSARAAVLAVGLAAVTLGAQAPPPDEPAPAQFRVVLDTTKGRLVVACTRAWAPRGVDRFYTLVRAGYYDDSAFFRVVKGKWAQFGIAARPETAQAWRARTFPDDPFVGQSNVKGTAAFAFAAANGRTTQVFFNLVDNSATHDREPFVVFGRIVDGLDVLDALDDEYGEAALGGIRAGRQDRLFQQGNAYLKANFPKLDYIRTARVEAP